MKGIRGSLLLCCFTGVFLAHAADPQATKLDFVGYTIRDRHCEGGVSVPFKCLELPADTTNVRARRYGFVIDPGSNYSLDLVSDPDKGRALMLGMSPYTDGCVNKKNECKVHRKDKVEFWAVHPGNDNAIDVRSRDPKFFSFDFKLDPAYQTPRRLLLHMQARQEIEHSHPVLAMVVQPVTDPGIDPGKAPIDLVFIVRDDKDRESYTGRDSDTPFFKYGRTIGTLRVQRNQWNRITLELLPAFNGSGAQGRVGVWLNGEKKADFRGDWGYRPSSDPKSRRIGLALDIYRAPFQDTTQKVYFANVNYASTYDDVMTNGH